MAFLMKSFVFIIARGYESLVQSRDEKKKLFNTL